MAATDQLARYLALLQRYAPTFNLISPRALDNIGAKLSDAQAYAAYLQRHCPEDGQIVDIGSGAGLPGIVIAISLPGHRVHLVERRRRRASFLRLAVAQLGLDNCTVWDADVRALRGIQAACVTAQAVASLPELYALSCHLHGESITLLSRKGEDYRAELAALEQSLGVAADEVTVQPLAGHGRLVAVRLKGGLGCRSSA